MTDNRKRIARALQEQSGAAYMPCLQALRATLLREEQRGNPTPMATASAAAACGDYRFFGLRRGGDAPPARGEVHERVGDEGLSVEPPRE